MNPKKFRKELKKIMPGYKWTVHRTLTDANYLEATGIQSAGFNRTSTLYVRKSERNSIVKYEVKSSGFGRNAPWLGENYDATLARALRGLQEHYEIMGREHLRHANDLQKGRGK